MKSGSWWIGPRWRDSNTDRLQIELQSISKKKPIKKELLKSHTGNVVTA